VHPSVLLVAATLVDYLPASHSCTIHCVLTPDSDYVPIAQLVQPSFYEVAISKVDYWPAGHSWS